MGCLVYINPCGRFELGLDERIDRLARSMKELRDNGLKIRERGADIAETEQPVDHEQRPFDPSDLPQDAASSTASVFRYLSSPGFLCEPRTGIPPKAARPKNCKNAALQCCILAAMSSGAIQ